MKAASRFLSNFWTSRNGGGVISLNGNGSERYPSSMCRICGDQYGPMMSA